MNHPKTTAVACSMLALSLAPTGRAEPKRHFACGVLEAIRGNDPAPWFERAHGEAPDAWPLVRRVAARKYRDGHLAVASNLYREFVANHPNHLTARMTYADFLRESSPEDDFAAKLASRALEDGLKQHPHHLGLIRRLFLSYEQRGLRERSMALFKKVLATPRADHTIAAASMAQTLFAADDQDARNQIDQIYLSAIAVNPNDAQLARAASEHFRTTNRLPEAIDMLVRHTKANPSSLDLRVRLGILQFAAERPEEAIKTLTQVLDIHPEHALAHQTLAKYYRRQNSPEKARPHAVARLEIRGGEAGKFVQLAAEMLAAEQTRDARLLLEKGLFYHPENAELAVTLAMACQRDPSYRGDLIQRFREAEALSSPDDLARQPEFQRAFAEALLIDKQKDAAEQRLRAAIKAFPADAKQETANALRRLADLWLADGRNQSAARALQTRADRLDPPSP